MTTHIFQSESWGQAHAHRKDYQIFNLTNDYTEIQAFLWRLFGLPHTLVAGSSGGGGGIRVKSEIRNPKSEINNIFKKFVELADKLKPINALLYTEYELDTGGSGFMRDDKWTPIIKLKKDLREQFTKLDKKTRNQVRKAEKNGVGVLLGQRQDLVKYLHLQKEVVRRKKLSYINSLQDLQSVWDNLTPAAKMKLYLAAVNPSSLPQTLISQSNSAETRTETPTSSTNRNNDKKMIIAGAIILYENNTMFYKSGAAADLGLKLNASNLLQWQVIKDGILGGYKYYNLEGGTPARDSTQWGITKFKLGFGAELRRFYRYSLHQRRWLGKGLNLASHYLPFANTIKPLIYP